MFSVHFCMHTSFTALNDILLRSFSIVNDLYTLVYDTEENDRNMEPCNTAKYGRIRSVWWTFTSVYCRVRISEPSTWEMREQNSWSRTVRIKPEICFHTIKQHIGNNASKFFSFSRSSLYTMNRPIHSRLRIVEVNFSSQRRINHLLSFP